MFPGSMGRADHEVAMPCNAPVAIASCLTMEVSIFLKVSHWFMWTVKDTSNSCDNQGKEGQDWTLQYVPTIMVWLKKNRHHKVKIKGIISTL